MKEFFKEFVNIGLGFQTTLLVVAGVSLSIMVEQFLGAGNDKKLRFLYAICLTSFSPIYWMYKLEKFNLKNMKKLLNW